MSTPTTQLDLPALMDVLQACAGQPALAGAEQQLTANFADLGYDSLAMLECAARLQTDYGIHLGDDVLFTLQTPQQLLAQVNRGELG